MAATYNEWIADDIEIEETWLITGRTTESSNGAFYRKADPTILFLLVVRVFAGLDSMYFQNRSFLFLITSKVFGCVLGMSASLISLGSADSDLLIQQRHMK